MMGNTPFYYDIGILTFPVLSYVESLFSFSRLLLFNIALVALNGNIIVSLVLLGLMEIIRAVLKILKGFFVSNTAIIERMRLLVGAVESLGFAVFFGATFYCWFIENDRIESNAVPLVVQGVSLAAVVVELLLVARLRLLHKSSCRLGIVAMAKSYS